MSDEPDAWMLCDDTVQPAQTEAVSGDLAFDPAFAASLALRHAIINSPDTEAATVSMAHLNLAVMAIDDLQKQLGDAREVLQRIADLGSDGEHSGDRHARCREFASAFLNGEQS